MPTNPPSSAPSGMFITQGLATVRWGTDGVLQDTGLTAAIVKSIKQGERVFEFKVENNAGFTACQFLLIDGEDCEVTVEDDTSKTWPITGGKMKLLTPDDSANVTFLVVNNNWNAARKQPGERVLKCQSFSAFTVS